MQTPFGQHAARLVQHRPLTCCCAVTLGLLLWPCAMVGQAESTHSRWMLGGTLGVSAVGGGDVIASETGISGSGFGAFHLGAGWMLRASAGLSAHGDAVRQVADSDGRAVKLASRGFDFLVFGIGPVYHVAPAASSVAPYLGVQVNYMNGISTWDGIGWGGGVIGGLTLWLSNSLGVESGLTATLTRYQKTLVGAETVEAYWTSGRVVTLDVGFVFALR